MEDKKHLLKDIVDFKLLAPSNIKLAQATGYPSKSTVYRIQQLDIGPSALSQFIERLNTHLGIGPSELNEMEVLIQDYAYLNSALKDERVANDPVALIMAFISRDYSCFSRKFVENELQKFLQYSQKSPIQFYQLLFLYYVKKRYSEFYPRKKTFQERCEEIIKPLGDLLREAFPANHGGADYLRGLSAYRIFEHGRETLWDFVERGAPLLIHYGVPDSYERLVSSFQLLPDTTERSYWLIENSKEILLALAVKGKKERSGFYELFRISISSGKIRRIGQMLLYPEDEVQIFSGRGERFALGSFAYKDGRLILDWKNGATNPLEIGDNWILLRTESVSGVKEFDKELTDSAIRQALLEGYGVEDIPGYEVTDVVLSRSKVRIATKGGKVLEIERCRYPFLAEVDPTETVVVLRRKTDGFEYVSWSDRNQSIPLSDFN